MKEKKRSFHMPTAYSILLALILIVAAVTWLIGGSVQRASLAQVVMAVPRGFLDAIDVCLFILILGGFLGVVTATGALDRGIGALVRRLRGHEMVLIPILMVLFSLGGTTYGMAEETMAFYALITATMVAAGFDAMVGAAVVLVGAGVGVLGSTVNPFAISAAVDAYQSAYPDAAVDYGRILLLGAVLWLTSLAAGIWLVMRYAAQVRKSGRSILTAAEQRQVRESYGQVERVTEEEADLRLSGSQKAALALFAVAFLVMVVALIPWEDFGVTWFAGTAWLTGEPLGAWYFQELEAWFFLAAIVVGVVSCLGEQGIIEPFLRGAGDMIGVVFIIAISRGISVLMSESGLDAWVLERASTALEQVSPALFVAGSYVIYLGLSFLIPSTSGLAAASMPTFAGLTAALGLSPEVMILIFCAACGVVNLITPTSAVVMGGLSICRVEWPTWLRFIWKFLILLIVMNLVIFSAAMYLL